MRDLVCSFYLAMSIPKGYTEHFLRREAKQATPQNSFPDSSRYQNGSKMVPRMLRVEDRLRTLRVEDILATQKLS